MLTMYADISATLIPGVNMKSPAGNFGHIAAVRPFFILAHLMSVYSSFQVAQTSRSAINTLLTSINGNGLTVNANSHKKNEGLVLSSVSVT